MVKFFPTMEDTLTRIQFRAKQTLVQILCEKDLAPITIMDGIRFGPFKKGKQYSVPFWFAVILVEKEFASIEQVKFDFNTLQDVANKELRENQIQPLPNYLLINFSLWNSCLEKFADSKLVPFQNYEKYQLFLQDLLKMRLGKLIKLALNPNQDQIIQNLPVEEQNLLEEITENIQNWRSKITGR